MSVSFVCLRVPLLRKRRGLSFVLLSLMAIGCLFGCDSQESKPFSSLPVLPDLNLSAVCQDQQDNDGDGLIDLADPGCDHPFDPSEEDPPLPPQCRDRIDNDEDGLIDLEDKGCVDLNDSDESDDPPPPQCMNQLDDDMDGLIDYPNDPGCSGQRDEDEQAETRGARLCQHQQQTEATKK